MIKLIPTERRQAFCSAILSTFGEATLQDISLIDGGSLSLVYKIKINNLIFIVRLMDLEESLVIRQNQITCMKKAITFGIAPACYYSDAEAGVIIMEYIHAQPVSVNEDWLKEIACSLRKLHHFDDFPPPHQPLFLYIQGLIETLRKMPLASLLIDYLQRFEEVTSILTPHLTQASAHNDLNCKNILFNGKTYFIDWEAAGIEDPFFDLATVCNEFISTKEQQYYFLKEYFETEPTIEQEAKILLMKQVSHCYLALHYLLHAVEGGLTLKNEDLTKEMTLFNDWVHSYQKEHFELSNASDFLKYALMQINISRKHMVSKGFHSAKQILLKSVNDDRTIFIH